MQLLGYLLGSSTQMEAIHENILLLPYGAPGVSTGL